MIKCRQCPNPAEPQEKLCAPCSVELAYRIMNAQPEPEYLECTACKAPFSFLEARVLRQAKDPHARLSHVTPSLCWVCAHLHLRAVRECGTCDGPHPC